MVWLQGVVLMGRPGAGKSSVGKEIAMNYKGSVFISGGDVARKLAETDPEVADALSNGNPCPEQKIRDAIEVVLNEVNAGGKMFILDGFPRFMDQARWLEERFPDTIQFNLHEEEIVCVERMLSERKRYDDNQYVIDKRMAFYNEQTHPMIMNLLGREDSKCWTIFGNTIEGRAMKILDFLLEEKDIRREMGRL